MKCIYLDVLIVLNVYVNYFLLKGTAKLTHTPITALRCTAASFLGSLFSLTIFLPDMGALVGLGIKLIAAVVICAAAFGIKNIRHTARLIIYFYIVNFIFAGFVMLMYEMFKPSFMAFNNSWFYIDFSLLSLVVFTAAAYIIVSVCRFFLDKGCDVSHRYKVIIKCGGEEVTVDAIADTGNSLVDSFSGKPVIICGREKLFDIKPELISDMDHEKLLCSGFRLIPYRTIGNTGLIPIFSPDEVIISDPESKKSKAVSALIGVNKDETPAIFNPGLLV